MSSDYSPRFMGGVATGVTADAGSAQGDGLLSNGTTVVSTVGTAGDAVTLPANIAQYQRMVVFNAAAVNAMDVFPNTGATINGGSANAALSVAAGTGKEFIQVGTDGLTWIAV